MYWGSIAGLFILGVLGAANLIISRKPEAKELIGKLAPYQGWIGVGGLFYGLYGLTWSVLSLGELAYQPIFWISSLVASFLLAALGLLFGIGTIKMFVKKPEAIEKMNQLVAKLAPKQGVLGIASLFMSVWVVIAALFFTGTPYDALDDWADAAYGQNAEAMAQAQLAMAQAGMATGQMAQQQALAQQQAAAQAAAAQAAAAQAGMAGQMAGQQAAAQAAAAQAAALQAAGQMAGQPVAAPAAPAPAAGTMATALVQQTWPAGVDAQQQPLLGMDLYVTPPAGTPYQVRLTGHPVPAAKQAMVAPNATINVSIDPTNPQKVTPIL